MPKANIETKETKSFEFKLTATEDGDENTLEGYANTFDVIDSQGDLVVPGAFKKTIRERVKGGKVKLIDSHIWDGGHTIGTVFSATEDEKGLFIKARFSEVDDAQAIRQKALEGHLGYMSIGFETIRQEDVVHEDNGKAITVRHLKEIKLYEVSIVPFPANEESAITSVKAEGEDDVWTRIRTISKKIAEDKEITKDAMRVLTDALKSISDSIVAADVEGGEDTPEPSETPKADVGAGSQRSRARARARVLEARLKRARLN